LPPFKSSVCIYFFSTSPKPCTWLGGISGPLEHFAINTVIVCVFVLLFTPSLPPQALL
jgi:hypothetical protein